MTLSIMKENKQILIPEDKILVIFPTTEEDYWTFSSEDVKVEFAEGRLYIHSPASLHHEDIVSFLLRYINRFYEHHDTVKAFGSRLAVKLPNNKRPEPDIVLLAENQIDYQTTVFQGIPKAVLEVTSPGTREHDLGEKLQWFQEAGIPDIIIIDLPEQSVYHYTKEGQNYIMRELQTGTIHFSTIADLSLEIDWFWTIPLPKIKDLPI